MTRKVYFGTYNVRPNLVIFSQVSSYLRKKKVSRNAHLFLSSPDTLHNEDGPPTRRGKKHSTALRFGRHVDCGWRRVRISTFRFGRRRKASGATDDCPIWTRDRASIQSGLFLAVSPSFEPPSPCSQVTKKGVGHTPPHMNEEVIAIR